MRTIKRISAVCAAIAMFCASAFLVAAPAQAATRSYNIMFVGSAIPGGVGSVATGVQGGFFYCVNNVQSGVDRNTGLSVTVPYGGTVEATFRLYGDSTCSSAIQKTINRTASSTITTKNWWVSLS